ncbi:hypothetical protein PQ469_24980 [Mucilaginibacter sp. KACC 22773]|uniref:hypothetical protein n=1 Tax=Mucilaginibacter sp. KACC 22773 TaxID=3025671 RepID=UPI002366AC3F|nr:hypothetical protein [Mucilaginibacter sp. KACC 22773]WDF77144.1 hypothetical protein PQ469_24980 [Mucilaginibacter sp. KACC 22773]
MKTYTLKGKNGKPDIDFSLGDLIPVRQKKKYDFNELVNLINYRDYEAVTPFQDGDYRELYRNYANKRSDFFTIRDTGIIVIPGNCIFPTLLTGNQII